MVGGCVYEMPHNLPHVVGATRFLVLKMSSHGVWKSCIMVGYLMTEAEVILGEIGRNCSGSSQVVSIDLGDMQVCESGLAPSCMTPPISLDEFPKFHIT